MAEESPFGINSSWPMTTSNDPTISAMPGNDLLGQDWDEWMRWDPVGNDDPNMNDVMPASNVFDIIKTEFPANASTEPDEASLLSRTLSESTHRASYQSPASSDSLAHGDEHGENTVSSKSKSIDTTPASLHLSQPYTNGFEQTTERSSGVHPLSLQQIRELRDIALPPGLGTRNDILSNSQTNSSSPESLNHTKSKKRKSSFDEEDSDDDPSDEKEGKPPVKKTAHNMIEKRYRTNLNDKIAALRDSVPSLRVMVKNKRGAKGEEEEDLEGLTPAHKLNKATILSKATEYIRHLEKRNRGLSDEISTLRNRLNAFEKLALSGAMAWNMPLTPSPDVVPQQQIPTPSVDQTSMTTEVTGMIQVPENIRRLHVPQTHQYFAQQQQQQAQQQQAQATYTAAPGTSGAEASFMPGGYGSTLFSKLMVGSLAGLMIIDTVGKQSTMPASEQREELFALPVHFLRGLLGPLGSSHHNYFHMMKGFILFTALIWLVMSILFKSEAKPRKVEPSSVPIQLSAASLASPVEARRHAWQTAMQSIWIPHEDSYHVVNVAVYSYKVLRLFLRKTLGSNFFYVAGRGKDHEMERLRAWDVAVDAQLGGGDESICWSRLGLTLVASTTLPDTPARLMLKAMHIRVLFWSCANIRYGQWMLQLVAKQLSRQYWNAAKDAQAALLATRSIAAASIDSQADLLPDFLDALLANDCDEVLTNTIVQRAYNLAWNQPTAAHGQPDVAMDSVVSDFAIRSPLEALAAWFSSSTLQKALLASHDDNDENEGEAPADNKNEAKKSSTMVSALSLAQSTAPPASGPHLRALTARALLIPTDRSAAVGTLLDLLPAPLTFTSMPFPTSHMGTTKRTSAHRRTASTIATLNVVQHTPPATDEELALILVKCHALLSPYPTKYQTPSPRQISSVLTLLSTLPFCPKQLTLLSFTAVRSTLRTLLPHPDQSTPTDLTSLPGVTHVVLEKITSCLRVWAGTSTLSGASGLSAAQRADVVSEALGVGRALAGLGRVENASGSIVAGEMEEDLGYVSLEAEESDVHDGKGIEGIVKSIKGNLEVA